MKDVDASAAANDLKLDPARTTIGRHPDWSDGVGHQLRLWEGNSTHVCEAFGLPRLVELQIVDYLC